MVLEVQGREVDPDCLHCVLADPIQAFIDAHKGMANDKIFGQLLQIAADYAASAAHESQHDTITADGPQLLARLLRTSFAGSIGYRRKRN